MMDIAHEPVEAKPEPRPRRRFGRAADNPLVGAVARVRLPLGAKLLAGFAVVGVLLVAGYVLGLSALGQSNARGEQLRRLQQKAVYYQLVDLGSERRIGDETLYGVWSNGTFFPIGDLPEAA